MLTKKQRDLLLLIHNRMSKGDIAPSFDEMRDLLGLKSKSGIHRLIMGLVERGYLARLPHRARALEVLRLPDGLVVSESHVPPDSKVGVIGTPPSSDEGRSSSCSIPLMGTIAAGTPIEAIRDEGTMIDVPNSMIGRGDYYALTVKGDSMIDAGIHNGDTVIIQNGSHAENGQIIVALVDEAEVTLKRLRRKDGMVILQAENSAYEDRVLDPSRVKIQGKLASLIRTYH